VDQSLIDRRRDPRFPPALLHPVRATLRPGCMVAIVNLSVTGALLEAARPLRPGARVHLQLITELRTLILPALVLRCVVWSLRDASGVKYRGALRFEQRSDWFGEVIKPVNAGVTAPGP
jgi:PilZ domain